jgi:hypothetical protein
MIRRAAPAIGDFIIEILDIPLPDEPYPPLFESLNKTPNKVYLINDVYIYMFYYGIIWKKKLI